MAPKRSAAAASNTASQTSSKRQQHDNDVQSLSQDDDVHTIHHRYEIGPPSDLSLTLLEATDTWHIFHLHQAILVVECKFFFSLINSKDREQHMTIDLPAEFEWSAKELDCFVQLCYRQLDYVIVPLACAPTLKHFSALWYREGAIVSDEPVNGIREQWLVMGHNDDGQAIVSAHGHEAEVVTWVPGDCVLEHETSAFHEKLTSSLDILTQTRLAHYLDSYHLVSILTLILLNLVEVGVQELLLDVAKLADTLHLTDLRSACLNAMQSYEWHDYKPQLTKLSAQFVVELLLPDEEAPATVPE